MLEDRVNISFEVFPPKTDDIIKIYDINSDEKYSYEIIIYGDVNGDGKNDIRFFRYEK